MIPKTTPALGFYIHHHGSGHLMRALTIAGTFPDTDVIFMGSDLLRFQELIPQHITCVHLPQDLPLENEDASGNPPGFLHYAPTGLAGIRSRMAIMAGVFAAHAPMLLMVDVSVEVAIFARLCSIPTVVVRQHGNRSDTAHLAAYESAALLLAPFSEAMQQVGDAPWLSAKTLFAGGFSRFTGNDHPVPLPADRSLHIAVLVGDGGSSIDSPFILYLAAQAPEYIFHVAGPARPSGTSLPENVVWHGKIADPGNLLRSCALVIGNAGHNTVMEMADLNKRFICIPESRPFDEQLVKAALLAQGKHARVILPGDLYHTNWNTELKCRLQHEPNWHGVTDAAALQRIRKGIAEQLALL